MEKPIKDRQLKQYELMEYFGEIARQRDPKVSGDMLLHRIAEDCPAQYLEDMDTYICGKLVGLFEVCLEALQSVPNDRATPIAVKSALTLIGQYLADIKDPKLQEMKEVMDA